MYIELVLTVPHLPWGLQRICGPFVFLELRDFVNQHVFLQSDLLGYRPKLTWGMQRVCGHFVLKTIVLPFESDTCWSFYFYTSGTFSPILTLFTHFALHQFFHDAEYCVLTVDDAVDRRKATLSFVCFFLFFLVFGFGNAFPSQIILTLC